MSERIIMIDTAIWIDFFHDRKNAHVAKLKEIAALGNATTCDLVLHEVLRGFDDPSTRRRVICLLDVLDCHEVLNKDSALRSAARYRELRRRGGTVRKPNDAIIASYCIDAHLPLLTSDKDFAGYVPLGLDLVAT